MIRIHYILFIYAVALVRLFDSFSLSPATVAQRSSSSSITRLSAKIELSPEDHAIAMEKATKAMTAFTNKYLELSVTKLCSDKSIPAVVIKGLAEHKVTLGAPLCPCRFYDDKEAEAKDGFWNCPCVPMRERSECHCMLFLNDDNQFAGQETHINYDEVITLASGMDS
jgi:ferredoxin-thioredoxin reductase catalytic chain